MLTLDALRTERRDDIMRLARRRGAENVRVFGSLARGEANENSDLDLLVCWEPGRSLLDHAGLVARYEGPRRDGEVPALVRAGPNPARGGATVKDDRLYPCPAERRSWRRRNRGTPSSATAGPMTSHAGTR